MSKATTPIDLNAREISDLCIAVRLRMETCAENGEEVSEKRWRSLLRKLGG